jgi:uncharacterized protein (TIGR03083 family)
LDDPKTSVAGEIGGLVQCCSMKRPDPILVTERFPLLRLRLLELLTSLSNEDWDRRTIAPLWSVKDIACHLLGGDLGVLSRSRDAFRSNPTPSPNNKDLGELINRLNSEWTIATRRLSPPVLCDLLAFTGPQVEAYFASLDSFATGQPVSWAGPEPAPVWLDIAREFTERWHHQQQIRDATGRPPLYDRYFLAPVLDAFVRALPFGYRDTAAARGTLIKFEISGEAGGCWFLLREQDQWELVLDAELEPATHVALTEDTAWRLFTRGMDGDRARSLTTIAGDSGLASPLFATLAIIA